MWKLLAPFLILLAAVGATVWSDRSPPRADFVFINRGDVSTLDLQKMSWMQDLRVARALFEGLVTNDIFSHEFDIRPGVAERWEVSPDGRTYTFQLRADAKWSNGAPVTAGDFVYSWRRAMLPDTVSDYSALFLMIRGAQEFYDWRTAATEAFTPDPGDEGRPLAQTAAGRLWDETLRRFDELVALKALDDRTLRFELAEPAPYFLDLCAFAVFYPVYPPLVKQFERPDPDTGRLEIRSGWTKPPLLVSNGPFVLTHWRFKRDMQFARNPHYWNQQAIALDTISMPSVEDPNAQVLAFNSGAADWTSDVTPPYRRYLLDDKRAFYAEHRALVDELTALGLDPVEIDRRLPDDPRKNIHAFPAFGTYFYNFNCLPKLQDGRDNPFHDPRVRRAFAMAVDKRRIVEEVRGVGERSVRVLIPEGSIPGYRSPKGVPFDPAAARTLLAEAGYPGGRGFPTVEILFNRDGGHDLIAQAVAKDWQEHLNVGIALQMREIKVFRNDLKKQNYMVSRAGWFGDYGDPTTFLDLMRSFDGNNDRKYNNPVYDDLLARAAREPDSDTRTRMLEEAERMIVDDDLPLIPIFQYVQMYLFDPDEITGISSHPRQEQNIYQVDRFGDGKGTDQPKMLPPRPAAALNRGD